jgi:hypothetical protein
MLGEDDLHARPHMSTRQDTRNEQGAAVAWGPPVAWLKHQQAGLLVSVSQGTGCTTVVLSWATQVRWHLDHGGKRSCADARVFAQVGQVTFLFSFLFFSFLFFSMSYFLFLFSILVLCCISNYKFKLDSNFTLIWIPDNMQSFK